MWYNNWFGTKYYDMLYARRDDDEAKYFLDHLVSVLHPSPGATFLDIGCGKGRHSVYLNSLGFDVTGLDLSSSNIDSCKPYENDHLHFFMHDMRRVFRVNCFDFALNVFTSFGYFEKTHHNQLAINAATSALKKGGIFVIDFLNASLAINSLAPAEIKIIDGIRFEISRSFEEGFIVKTIKVLDNNIEKCFYEKVQALQRSDFEDLFDEAGLKTLSVYGDYNFGSFDAVKSPRLILTAIKS